IARCNESSLRREWRRRLVDHDGESEGDGGIARWLKLTDGLGLDRDYVVSLAGLLPATRFAVEAYVHFVRENTLLEAIASSLTELFSPQIIDERLWHAQELRLRERRQTRLFLCAPTSRPARLRLRACLRQAPRQDAGYSARGAQSARVQMRRAMGNAGWALSCVCSAEASSARRIRAE